MLEYEWAILNCFKEYLDKHPKYIEEANKAEPIRSWAVQYYPETTVRYLRCLSSHGSSDSTEIVKLLGEACSIRQTREPIRNFIQNFEKTARLNARRRTRGNSAAHRETPEGQDKQYTYCEYYSSTYKRKNQRPFPLYFSSFANLQVKLPKEFLDDCGEEIRRILSENAVDVYSQIMAMERASYVSSRKKVKRKDICAYYIYYFMSFYNYMYPDKQNSVFEMLEEYKKVASVCFENNSGEYLFIRRRIKSAGGVIHEKNPQLANHECYQGLHSLFELYSNQEDWDSYKEDLHSAAKEIKEIYAQKEFTGTNEYPAPSTSQKNRVNRDIEILIKAIEEHVK